MKRLILTTTMLVLPWAATAPASRLLDPVAFQAGSNSRGIASADINGDGLDDVAVANFGSATLIGAACPASNSSIALFMGSAAGLVPGVVIPTGEDAPRGLTFADINGDGLPDLLATYYCSAHLAVFLNRGAGQFGPPQLLPCGVQPVGVAAQLNAGSGFIAVAAYGSNAVSLYRVDKGTLTRLPDLAVGANPTDLKFYPGPAQAGPVLWVADFGASALTRLALNPDGSLLARSDVPVPGQPCKIAVGDLNGDGWPDVAVARFADSSVSVFLGQSDGSVAAQPVSLALAGSHPNGVAWGHLGGASALVTADRDSDQVEVLHWAGQGLSLTAAIQVTDAVGNTGTYGPVDAVIADVNGDGFGDVAVTHMRSGRLLLLDGAPAAAPSISSGTHPDPQGWSAATSLRATFQPGPDLDGIRGWQAVLDDNPGGQPGPDAIESAAPAFAADGLSTGVHYLHVRAVDAAGKLGLVGTYRVGVTAALSQQNTYNYPNPTRDGNTTIRFPLAAPADVQLRIYDETGGLVWSRDLTAAQTQGGVNTVAWDGRSDSGRPAANGGYILTLRSGGTLITKKIAIVR